MKKSVLALACVAALAGCGKPTITGASADQVFIRYDPALAGPPDLQPQANTECGRYGKVGAYRDYQAEGPLGMRIARFDCVAPPT